MNSSHTFPSIEDYFLIGDLHTSALVSNQGSVDWLCLPNFDSPSVFGQLLDPHAGSLSLDMPDYKVEASYAKDSAIVEFQLTKTETSICIKDFMVPQAISEPGSQFLVRQISNSTNGSQVRFKFCAAPQYGSINPETKLSTSSIEVQLDEGLVILHLPSDTKVEEDDGIFLICIDMIPGSKKNLILEYLPEGKTSSFCDDDLEVITKDFWKEWVGKGSYFDFCRDNLVRSAITLKLLQFYPTGAIVAAPTTSLPEELEGIRNWDYRFVWIRDATFALYAFNILGYHDEAERFFSFIESVTQKCAVNGFDVSLMYTIWGEPTPNEYTIENMSGYKNSRPVRVGNDATKQFQLDVYGALIDAIYFANKNDLTDDAKKLHRSLVVELIRKIDALWQTPDHGIWEARVGPKHYTYSKVMAWVGADRVKRLEKSLDIHEDELQICDRLSESIKDWIWENCFKTEQNNFVQHPETSTIDATNFLFVLLQFLDKHDPLTKEIIASTGKELCKKEVFVYRYLNHDGLPGDGLPGDEGAFLLCSFWLVSALAILEEMDEAIAKFKILESHFQSHGLLAEEIDTETNEYLGNYPQAFSHMGYIMAAYYIERYAKRNNIEL